MNPWPNQPDVPVVYINHVDQIWTGDSVRAASHQLASLHLTCEKTLEPSADALSSDCVCCGSGLCYYNETAYPLYRVTIDHHTYLCLPFVLCSYITGKYEFYLIYLPMNCRHLLIQYGEGREDLKTSVAIKNGINYNKLPHPF